MTGFADTFTELRSGRPHNNPNAVLAAVLADACNLGIEKMADASQGISYAQLAWTHSWYLSDETYRSALATIINAHHALPLAAAGEPVESSSDGQYFRARSHVYLWEQAAIAVDGFRPLILREVASSWSRDRTFALCPS